MEKLGIEKLKSTALLIINLTEEIAEKTSDGKLSIWEAITVAGKNSKDIIDVIRSGQNIFNEYTDLDSEEWRKLIEFVEIELDLQNEEIEDLVEDIFEWVAITAKMISRF